jgi:nucleoside-triphosphate--adenylate kinase
MSNPSSRGIPTMRIFSPIHQFVARRSIAHSVHTRKALPLSLNTYRNAQLHDDREHDQSPMLRMLMFGKPGAGKGTLTSWLVEKYDIVSLSTGDLVRQHIAEGTEVGHQAKEIVARGGLLPDQVMLKVVTSKLDFLHNKVGPVDLYSNICMCLYVMGSIGFLMVSLVHLAKGNF